MNADDMFNKGMEMFGDGNLAEAVSCLEDAARAGSSKAWQNLTLFYGTPHFGLADADKFLMWMKRFADELSDGWAKVILGVIYSIFY